MDTKGQRVLNWLGLAAIGLGGANLSIYTISSIISTQGTIVIPLFAFGLLLAYCANFGYLELVLMYPEKSGGITVACADALKPYSPILVNIIGIGYWFAWLIAASFAALYLSTTVQQLAPWVSINWLSTLLILAVTSLQLCGLTTVQRFAIPIALLATFTGLLTVAIPIFYGTADWSQLENFTLISPFYGTFGHLSSIMAALYVIGWVVPGYEATLCYVNRSKEPEKTIPKAMYACMGLAALFYVAGPFIWFSVIGPTGMVGDLSKTLSPVYVPLFGHLAQVGIIFFVVFNLLIGLFAPLGGPPRTLAQLADDGYVPEILGFRTATGMPWVATLLTAALSIIVIWVGAPTWLIAATTFQYVLAITIPSIAVWLLRNNEPNAPRPYRAPTLTIYLGLLASATWIAATILGFRQYGLSTVILGIIFTFIGFPLYFWRVARDRFKQRLVIIPKTLHIKLTGTLLTVLIIDAVGYLIAVDNLGSSNLELVAILEDIFVIVALLTLTAGLILPGTIIYMTKQVNSAANRIIKNDLAELTEAMEQLSEGNLQKPLIKSQIAPIYITTKDELGDMANSFNIMQLEIQNTAKYFDNVRNRLVNAMNELKELNKTLEDRVHERTNNLNISHEKLKKENAMRIKAQSKIASLHSELVTEARRAGMADVASSTLHNIGNVLSSVNTSISLMQENLLQSQLQSLKKLNQLFNEHTHDFEKFILEDPKAKFIPKYLSMITEASQTQNNTLLEEISQLKKNIEHINQIISMQQSLSRSLGMVEVTSIENLIQDALALNKSVAERAKAEIDIDCAPLKKVSIDRVQLLQIIVNLIKNSFESLLESPNEKKELHIIVKPINNDNFSIIIKDNGIGITSENLKKIFSSGFTTKKSGHGYGLHGSAISANQLGGSLSAHSEGKGATFILTLPFEQNEESYG